MHYIVDGYNLFFKLQEDTHSFTKRREDLIQTLNAVAEKFHLSFTIVFDRKYFPSSFFPSKRRLKALEVVYTPENVSADSYILELLTAHPHPENEIIVTDDKELDKEVRGLKGKTQTVEAFFSFLIKREKNRQKGENKQEKENKWQMHRLHAIFEKRLKENKQEK